MEGLMDFHLREILTAVGGIDHCVTEFIRVSQTVLPNRVFLKYCPELAQGGKTLAGTPVHIQLLGSDPELMAANAARVAALGAPAIDLNFGCPAKTVNRSQGGAVLLQYTERLYAITRAVRDAVPDHIPVSAKMRLGYTDKTLAVDNAQALASAGIQWLTVHARTKTEGYKPPAWWQWIAEIKQALDIPVLANGEIWTPDQAQACQQQSQSRLLMIGRGLVAKPDLGLQIRAQQQGIPYQAMKWQDYLTLCYQLAARLEHLEDKQLTDRMKQWLHYYSLQSAEMSAVFQAVRRHRSRRDFFAAMASWQPA
ncbi:tRNA dihydrouridine synthase [Oceanobacter sp. 4_MG-2023]|uniref:tRNA dihydrouridine synthase n=1 Tax=unclassified Oceanobacter TaxID=2620260 RepID=UPI00351E5868